nr:nicotinate (nicotinamide) nucleotide adenylyltransferase [Eubacterium sp.]
MSRIGILGGSFNPPHKAHIKLAVAAYEQYGLDKVLFIPNHHPPHKSEEEFVSDEHRTRMVKKMISSDKYKNFEFSDIELVKDELSYTYKTLEELKKIYPKDQLFFIMGADSLEYFSTWKNPKRIAEIATILVAPRGESDKNTIKELIKLTKKEIGGKYHYLRFDKKYAEISSTDIRDAIISGEAAKQIPKKVLLYIRLHGLYGCEPLIFENINQDELKKALKATLDNKRYVHTLGVAETAKELGRIYGEQSVDAKLEEKAYMAGLLHDCAKYY